MGMLLAFVGGYLDAYTYITRDGVFATAQTGNTVLFAVRAASQEYSGAIQNVPPFLAFVAGVLVAELIKDKLKPRHRAVLIHCRFPPGKHTEYDHHHGHCLRFFSSDCHIQ